MAKVKNLVLTVKNELKSSLKRNKSKGDRPSSLELGACIEEVRKYGYCVIPNYLDNQWCDLVLKEIDLLIEKHQDRIWKDDLNSDHRIFGADRVSELISEFYANSSILAVVKDYLSESIIAGFTLAARLEAKEGNVGSGGGWHRDAASRRQIKAITYLSDVEIENGPFQFIRESHLPIDIMKRLWDYNLDYNQTRFKDLEIDKMIKKKPRNLVTLNAKKGTLILVDTRGIHRGAPIERGVRYALTNYYWEKGIPDHINKMLVSS